MAWQGRDSGRVSGERSAVVLRGRYGGGGGAVTVLLFMMACRTEVPPPEPVVQPEPLGAVHLAPQDLQTALTNTAAFSSTRPEYERPLGTGQVIPEGLSSLSSESCGTCHVALYEEWKVSTHAAAWRDPQYQVEIQKSDNRWLCLNCHSPLLVQQDVWPVGLVLGDVERPQLVANPGFDEALRDEGIGCAGCHVRDGVIHGPGLGGNPPHPVQADASYASGELCFRCHQATATYPGKTFVCVFDTGAEWAAGPYPDEGKNCVTCHMPAVTRPAAVGGSERTVARHWWRGAGIPKFAGVHPPPEANPPGLELKASWTDAVVVTATNANAGHYLPSGDPERWVQVTVQFEDADGSGIGEAWTTRFGQEWTWWPEPEKHGDTRLAPRESRTFTVRAPSDAVRATVTGSSHRMSEETAAYHELEDYPLSIQTHELVLTAP